MFLTLVAGARPNFMKIAPLMRALRQVGAAVRLVHTGQHYDERMSQTFFKELDIPEPDVNLEVGSGSHVWQIAEVMRRLEGELAAHRPDAVVVVGDVNSTVAAAVTAVKMNVPVAHVEAGLRSFDRTMPEEVNRVLTDSIARWLFASEPSALVNLRREGVPDARVHFVGNVMIDTLLEHRERARGRRAYSRLGLEPGGYVVLTLHRPSNVDVPERLQAIVRAVEQLSHRLKILFVVHPRTRDRLARLGVGAEGNPDLLFSEPLGYLDMLSLVESARLVMTDSGGLQEETTALGVPCLTLRENTERPVTLEVGTNTLVESRTENILAAAARALAGGAASAKIPEKWDGRASERIAAILQRDLDGRGNEGHESIAHPGPLPAAPERLRPEVAVHPTVPAAVRD